MTKNITLIVLRISALILGFLIGLKFARADDTASKSDYSVSLEGLAGGITYHLVDTDAASAHYIYKLNANGRLIYNSLWGYGVLVEDNKNYFAIKTFLGDNSVGLPMMGSMLSYGWKWHGLYYGPVLGVYFENDDAYRAMGVQPFRIAEDGSMGIVPIIGIELNYRIDLTDRVYLKLNNVITPYLTNTSLSLGCVLN